MNENTRTVFFPFAKGIPYKLKNGRYIIPELDLDSWQYAVKDKKIVPICHGGFLEHICATMVVESIAANNPSKKIEWISDKFYEQIWKANGIGKKSDVYLDKGILQQYPAPLFFDADDTIVFSNCLNNYLTVNSIRKSKSYNDSKAATMQIFRNAMVPWRTSYLPKMRNLSKPDLVDFDESKPFIVLFPDVTGMSEHDVFGLDWTINDVRSFASMLRNTKYQLVIVSPNTGKYFGLQAKVFSSNINTILYLLSKAEVVLSKEVDFSISSLVLGNVTAFSLKLKGPFDLKKNKKFLQVDNTVFINKSFTPYEVYQELAWKK